MANIKRAQKQSTEEHVEKKELLCPVAGNGTGAATMENSSMHSSKSDIYFLLLFFGRITMLAGL